MITTEIGRDLSKNRFWASVHSFSDFDFELRHFHLQYPLVSMLSGCQRVHLSSCRARWTWAESVRMNPAFPYILGFFKFSIGQCCRNPWTTPLKHYTVEAAVESFSNLHRVCDSDRNRPRFIKKSILSFRTFFFGFWFLAAPLPLAISTRFDAS